MSFLGKVFTFLVFIFSITFFAVALMVNSSHRDWKTAVMDPQKGFVAQKQSLQRNLQELQGQLEKAQRDLAQEQVARKVTLSQLQTQLDQEREKLAQLTAELQKMQAANTLQTQTLAATQDELARVTKENTDIKTQIVQVIQERDVQTRKAITLADDLNNRLVVLDTLTKKLDVLRDSATVLEARNITMKNALDRSGIKDDLEDVPPSDLNGLVNAVDRDGLIEISIGRDDGLREGHELDVYRGSSYLGRVRIIRTDVDKSIAKIMDGYRRGYIQKDDKVVAKLGL
jgi:multidrug efflux pump subunit AcrA (membrane-fusion protein)